MDKVRFAIVGTGAIAPIHAQVLANLPDAELTAVYGRSPQIVQKFADKYHCSGYTDYQAMLKNGQFDAVSICAPNGVHAKLGIAAARAGKHVLVEKPLEINLEAADALIAACHEQQVKLGVIFQRRYSEGVMRLKKLLDEGKLGKILFGGCYIKLHRSQEYYDSGAWRGTWELDGGGVLMNQGIHYIDLLHYLAGDVATITGECATLGHERICVEDTAAATLRFASGAIGVIEGTTCAYPGISSRLDLYGTAGSAVLENDQLTAVQLCSGYTYQATTSTEQAGIAGPEISNECHERQFAKIVEAIREDHDMPVTGEAARKSLEIILAIYRAAMLRTPVPLPLPDSSFLRGLAAQGGFR